MNKRLPTSKRSNMTLSNGWLLNSRRHGRLRSLGSHGASGDADKEAIADRLPAVRILPQKFEKKEILNADQFQHSYCMAPDRTTRPGRLPSRKKE